MKANKKFISITMLMLIILTLSACSGGQEKDKTSGADAYINIAQKFISQEKYTEAIDILNEGISVTSDGEIVQMLADLLKKTGSISNSAPSVSVKAENSNTIPVTYDTLLFSAEEKVKVNIFLSNFCEAYFENYSNGGYPDQLISFAFIHNLINNNDKIFYKNSEMGIKFEDVNNTLMKYFGTTVKKDCVTSEWTYKNGAFCKPAASGENYSYFSIVNKIYRNNADNTLIFCFSTYSPNDYEESMNKYYSYTPPQAINSCIFRENGIAVVKEKEYNGKQTYELISYTTGTSSLNDIPSANANTVATDAVDSSITDLLENGQWANQAHNMTIKRIHSNLYSIEIIQKDNYLDNGLFTGYSWALEATLDSNNVLTYSNGTITAIYGNMHNTLPSDVEGTLALKKEESGYYIEWSDNGLWFYHKDYDITP